VAALWPIAVLALVQGITEFLPISSSGHLILVWGAFDRYGVPVDARTGADRLILDIAVHVGTLVAVMLYFWRDVARLAGGFLRLLAFRMTPGGRLFLLLVVGTIPVVVAGVIGDRTGAIDAMRTVEVIAWASIGFGILLYAVDVRCMTLHRMEHTTFGGILFIGVAQVLALIPGTSRSGITMTAARFLGYERSDAARLSMLLSIPTILGAGTLAGKKLYDSGNVALGIDALIAAGLAFLSALAAIALMMAWLRRASFTPFVVYRVLLGLFILYLIYVAGVTFPVAA
jgi:undecaprenyl-diphosphatase